jgi:hypothetical protein
MIHHLKIKKEYFMLQLKGDKNYELRKDDRDFQTGDILVLQLIDNNSQLTGDEIDVVITSVLRNCEEYGLQKGFAILGTSFLRYQVRNKQNEFTESTKEDQIQ